MFGIKIDFPEIQGASDRQVWYAEKLREEYVRQNENRFCEIAELTDCSECKKEYWLAEVE